MKRIYTRKPDPIEAWQYDGSEAMARAIAKELGMIDEHGNIDKDEIYLGNFVYNSDLKGGLRIFKAGTTSYISAGGWFFFYNSTADIPSKRLIYSGIHENIERDWNLAEETNELFGEPVSYYSHPM